MDTEVTITLTLCGVAAITMFVAWSRVEISHSMRLAGAIALWIGFPLAVFVMMIDSSQPTEVEQVTYRPIAVTHDGSGYVGSDTCRSCHPHHHATWKSSYHRTMTQVASRDTVLAPIDDVRFESDGAMFQLRWNDDELFASMDVPRPGTNTNELLRINTPVVLTTGSHHMQLFWFPLREDTRLLGMFPYVYLRDDDRWIPRGAAFLQPAFGLSDEVGRWNRTCIACHTTFGRTRPARRMDARTGQVLLDANDPDSYVAEFGISCEACHGHGEEHVRKNRDPLYRYRSHLSGGGDETITNPAKLPHVRNSEVCGQCHSVQWLTDSDEWMTNGFPYRPGDDLSQSKLRFIVRLDDKETLQHVLNHDPAFVDDHFWSDGMVRISGREYNGLLDSPCFQRGELSCLSCHQMHQKAGDARSTSEWADDQLRSEGLNDQACVQCHAEFDDERILANHTHHDVTSSGSRCYNCHMPHTTYGLLKAIRSHKIDSPSVAASVQTGRPNACNQCHLDRTLDWTAQRLSEWYGIDAPQLSEDEQTIAASVLWLLRGDAGQRALMAWSYGWKEAQQVSGTQWMAPYLAQLMDDSYAAVRYIAARSLKTMTKEQIGQYDFLGDAAHIDAARKKIVANWSNEKRQPKRAVLVDDKGDLRWDVIERLLLERDNRPITLVE